MDLKNFPFSNPGRFPVPRFNVLSAIDIYIHSIYESTQKTDSIDVFLK